MNGEPSEDLELRRRRLRFRAWHRGTRELDLLLGRFVDAQLAELGERDIGAFEALMEVPDTELYGWITGGLEIPASYDTPLLRRLRAFHGAAR